MGIKSKKKIFIGIIMALYTLFILPSHFSIVYKYLSLKSRVHSLDLEIQALAGSLMSASDVDYIIKNSGYEVKLCSVMETVNNNSLRSYNGEDLGDLKPRVLEYILEIKNDDVNYLLSYLSNYDISYSNISVLGEEVFLKIYCN